jgi:hypothetical protein
MIVRIYGGLGNQMFQYAAGKSISLDRSDTLMLDTGAFGRKDLINLTSRKLDILDFQIDIIPENYNDIRMHKYPNGFISKLTSFLSKKLLNNYFYGWHPELYRDYKLTYLDGYFQSEKYSQRIKKNILKSFKLKKELDNQILFIKKIFLDQNFIGVHVRRGDYFNNPSVKKWHGICNLDYYERGISYLLNKYPDSRVAIFSDNIDWCKKHLTNIENPFYVSEYAKNNKIELRSSQELILLSQCQNFVISNSTFSWWAQYLCMNNEKKIVSPSVWNLNPRSKSLDLINESWYTIKT